MTDSLGSAIKRTSSRAMLRGNETWTEKDKHLINVKTTRNNVGKRIKYKILILQSIRLIDSDCMANSNNADERSDVAFICTKGASVGVYSMWGLCGGREARN